MMVEASANEVSEDVFLDALDLAHEEIKKAGSKCRLKCVKKLVKKKMEFTPPELPEEYKKAII